MTKYCRWVIILFYDKSSVFAPLFVRGVQHTLFRGNDEVLSAICWFSPRRIFGVPAVICERHPISSHARKRESRGGARKTLRCFSCGNDRLDSRFRGNDEVLSAGYCLSLRRIFSVPAVICERHPISSHARQRGGGGGRHDVGRTRLPAASRRRRMRRRSLRSCGNGGPARGDSPRLSRSPVLPVSTMALAIRPSSRFICREPVQSLDREAEVR